MSYDPNNHHRHSIRLKGYDYSQEGLYYITICVQDRVCLFGNVGAPLVGAQYYNDSQYNIDVQNGRPRGHAPTCAQYNNDYQKNVNAPNDDEADNIIGHLDDDGDDGRPRGHAPTCAQYNNDAPKNVNAPNDDEADNIIGHLDDDGQNGRTQGHARTCAPNDDGRMDDDGGQIWGMDDDGRMDDNGRQIGQPRGIAPTHAPIMILNDAGKMVETEWLKLTERFPNIELHEYVVMPNHFHGILQIGDMSSSRKTVGDMMDAFKSITTVEYIRGVKQSGWKPFDGKLWQRNYWEHIIRDEQSYQTISDYIINNPAKWKADKFFNQ